MAREVYHLARENRKKVGGHIRKSVKALPHDQRKKKRWGVMSEERIVTGLVNSKCSSYCMFILSGKHKKNLYI